MAKKSEEKPVTFYTGDDRHAVVLPCEPEHFRDFIAGLLGRPQTIADDFCGPFEVTRDELQNLHHLIQQRIASQNDAQLIQFSARIVYDDNSSVLLNSFEDFISYMWTRYAFFVTCFFVVALVVSIVIGVLVGTSADNRRPSFVILSRKSKDARVESLRRYQSNWVMFLCSLIGTVCVGVLGNYVFHKLSHYWAL